MLISRSRVAYLDDECFNIELVIVQNCLSITQCFHRSFRVWNRTHRVTHSSFHWSLWMRKRRKRSTLSTRRTRTNELTSERENERAHMSWEKKKHMRWWWWWNEIKQTKKKKRRRNQRMKNKKKKKKNALIASRSW